MGSDLRFTDRSVNALKAKAQRYEVWEDGRTGFGVRVAPSGRKSWLYMYRFQGKPRRMTLGTYPGRTLATAKRRHAEAHERLDLGSDPGAELVEKRKVEREANTVIDLANEYLERYARPNKKSADADERTIKAEILPLWGQRKAVSITRRDIINLLDSIVDRGSPVSANRVHALLNRIFSFAVERDIIAASPCILVKRPTKETARERVLSGSEVVTFWHGLDKAKMSPQARLALRLLLVTAQRREEVVCAPWVEFDLSGTIWNLPGARTKNGVPHRVPLSNLALELLEEVRASAGNSDWLFPSPRGDKPMQPDAISHALRNNLNTIGLENVTPHDLRRTAVSMMTEMGINRLITEKIINHKDRGVASIYDRFGYDRPKTEALEAWSERLREIVSGSNEKANVVALRQDDRQSK